MLTIAATHSTSGVIYGVALIVIGILHFVFRGFYARRGKAFHDARQATAPAATQRFYRSHSEGWYRRSQYWLSGLFILFGVVEIALQA
jgi:hypothetical protein